MFDEDGYCHLHAIGLCPDCEEREAEEAAHDSWVDNQIKWEREERLLGAD
jgi:hypothetical protein